MLHTTANNRTASFAPIGLSPASDQLPRVHRPSACAACDRGARKLTYGDGSDGLVLCRECRSLLFYCDLGGQG